MTTETSAESETPTSSLTAAAPTKKSSVRDLINNMNKVGGDKSAETTPTADVFRQQRKAGSLPRGTNPPQGDSEAAEAAKSSSKDDPRILKLDDDFAYDEVLDV